MHELDWTHILSSAGGGGVVMLLAKALLDRAMGELTTLTRRVEDLMSRLAALSAKLERLDDMHETMMQHDRRLAVLEAQAALGGHCHGLDSGSHGAL